MPGKGRVAMRKFSEEEFAALATEAKERKSSLKQFQNLLGQATCDVYLNDSVYWRNVPLNVWEFHMGGYQVIKKWLSYRESVLLGRSLEPDEAREVTGIARRLAGILLLQPDLDKNYQAVKDAAFPWKEEADS
jgi:hypothetical protein